MAEFVQLDGISDEFTVDPDAAVIDFLVKVIFVPYEFRYRVFSELLLNGHFHFDIPLIVDFEGFPLLRGVRRPVKALCPFVVGVGTTEVPDQSAAFGHLLLLQTQGCADLCQGERKPVVCCPNHVTPPCSRIKKAAVRIEVIMCFDLLWILLFQPIGEAHPLKAGVVCEFGNFVVTQSIQDAYRQLLTGCQVENRDRPSIDADAEKQNVKIRILRIAVDTGFPDVCRRAGFQVDT